MSIFKHILGGALEGLGSTLNAQAAEAREMRGLMLREHYLSKRQDKQLAFRRSGTINLLPKRNVSR